MWNNAQKSLLLLQCKPLGGGELCDCHKLEQKVVKISSKEKQTNFRIPIFTDVYADSDSKSFYIDMSYLLLENEKIKWNKI